DGDASAVIVAVQRLAAVAGERDEMGGREDEVVLRHRYAKLTARRHGPNFLHRPAMSSLHPRSGPPPGRRTRSRSPPTPPHGPTPATRLHTRPPPRARASRA